MIVRHKQKKRRMILAIDCDGTIVEDAFPKVGKLKKDAKKYINKLYAEGKYIILWTCRAKHHETTIKNFLLSKGVKFHLINKNYPALGFETSPKIYADIYIDDRGLGSVPGDWKEIYAMVKKQLGESNV